MAHGTRDQSDHHRKRQTWKVNASPLAPMVNPVTVVMSALVPPTAAVPKIAAPLPEIA